MNNESIITESAEVSGDPVVLIVDDDPTILKTTALILKNAGFTVNAVSTGTQAVEIITAHPDMLLLIDYQLPDLTAPQVVAKLKAQMIDFSFIVMTGHGDEEIAVAIMKLGARDYVTKTPQLFELLVSKVQRVCREIASEKKLQQAQERHRVEMEKSRQQKEALEERLLQSQKMEAIGQLAGGIAHDFNNLLGGIMGYADVLRMRLGDSPKALAMVEKIIGSTTRAADLIKQLLLFSRQIRVEYREIDMHELIRRVIAVITSTPDSAIRIVQSLEAPDARVTGDPSQLEAVLFNIADNARNAVSAGGVITFMTRLTSASAGVLDGRPLDAPVGAYLCISIGDSGEGMNEETRRHLFEPFFTTREVGKGSGLGLASAYGCVRQHKGFITVESALGKGTEFVVYLPVSTPAAAQAPISVETPSRVDRPQGVRKIMVVDDEAGIRDITSQMLTHMGFEPVCFGNSREAIEYTAANIGEIHAVVLDVTMPGMDGFECLKELKKLNSAIRVLMMTGFPDAVDDERARTAGIRVLLRKPFLASEMRQALIDLQVVSTAEQR